MASIAPIEDYTCYNIDYKELAQKQLWFSSYCIHIVFLFFFIINTENSHNNQI